MAEFTSLNGYQVKDTVARSIAKGRNQAVAFTDYATMIEALNEYEKDEYKAGQNVYIGVVGVPDLWVYSVEDIRHTFIYESDDDIVDKLKNYTTVQVGFFKLAMLEGQKVDLTTYDQHLAKHDEDIEKNATDISELNSSLGGIRLGQKDGEYGYFTGEGADTFCPFKSGSEMSLLKSYGGNFTQSEQDDVIYGDFSDKTVLLIESYYSIHTGGLYLINAVVDKNKNTYIYAPEKYDSGFVARRNIWFGDDRIVIGKPNWDGYFPLRNVWIM